MADPCSTFAIESKIFYMIYKVSQTPTPLVILFFFLQMKPFVIHLLISLYFCCSGSLQFTGSLVGAQGLSCPVARGILAPEPGTEPASPALQGRFLMTGPSGEILHC